MKNRTKGAFINARYSTDNQNPDSIQVQVEKCTEWCKQNNIPVIGVYADDAVSGMKNTRPQYEQMMMQLRMGIADTVVIYDQSRMFRKMTAWFAFRDEIESLGVKVICVTQPMIGKDLRDPTNFMAEGSMALFNQVWALQSRQKTIEKMRFMARNGQHTGGVPALGYTVENGRLTVCEDEAATVRRIFEEYANGLSYREIIAGLNRDGIKTKRGKAFGTNSLHDLLKNEKYIGVLTYGASPYREDGTRNTHSKDGTDVIRLEDAVPEIVEKELFYKVQEKMSQNKKQQGGRPPKKRSYPLKGKVFCADCKSAMTIATSQMKYDYYRCSGKKRKHDCDCAPISVDDLEKQVADAVRAIFQSPKEVDSLIKILHEQRSEIQGGAVATLQAIIAERKDIEKKLENATDAILNGLSSPTLLNKIQDMETQKAKLDAQALSLKKAVDASALPDEVLRESVEMVVADGYSDEAILSIVSRVEVGKDTITIWTILDTDPSGEIDFTQEGVIKTLGTTSGVPTVFVTSNFLRIIVARIKKGTS